jgi:hypothetical protein
MARTKSSGGKKRPEATYGPHPTPAAGGNDGTETNESNTDNETDKSDDPQESASDGDVAGNTEIVDDVDDDDPVNLQREFVCDFYRGVIGLNKTASFALYVDENMTKLKDFLKVKPESIEKICLQIRKTRKTQIPVTAMDNLTLLAYYAKHQERTSRNDKSLTMITGDDLAGLAHHMEVELNWDKKHKIPDPTPVTLDETSAHKAFNNMRHLLAEMRGHSDIPLTYVIRPRILPPDWGTADNNYEPRFGEANSPYSSIDDELTLRAPILKENRREWHNFTNFETLEEDGARTPTFNTDNATVFLTLQSYWGRSPAWTNAKKYLKTRNGRAAYRELYNYFFGKTMTASSQDRIIKNLQTYRFDAERRGFTFETFVNKHVEQHNLHQELTDHGVDPLPEQMKILYFKEGIKDPRFDSVHSAILVDRERFTTFDSVKEVFLTHSRNISKTSDAAAARDRRGVSSVHGRSGGRTNDRAGHGPRTDSRRGRGTGKSRLDGIPSQIEIDRCTHIEARHYPWSQYSKFTPAEKQKHFQLMHKDTKPGTGPCRDRRQGDRSVASTMTDGSSSNRKRSASTMRMDTDDNDKSLFSDSDDGASKDRHKTNRANARQPQK